MEIDGIDLICRGDTPFCSEECRQEQIDMDENNEKNRKLSSIKDQKKKKSSSPSKAQNNLHFRPGTVVAGWSILFSNQIHLPL